MSDDQIRHMVQRFLGWKLPSDFQPDCGIKFDADAAKEIYPTNLRYEPVGTNLFSYTQAEAMVRHMLEGLPAEGIMDAADASGAFVGQHRFDDSAKPNEPTHVWNGQRWIALKDNEA